MAGVEKQINQMISFIEVEAREKAKEIETAANEDFTIEKQRLVEAEKLKIRKDYERKEKQVEVQKKIGQSNEIKAARLKVLKLREEILTELVADAQKQLAHITANREGYKNLLRSLIVQGALKLNEPRVTVACRAVDRDLVQSVIASAAAEYQAKCGKPVDISIDTRTVLAPECSGGVVMAGFNGKIRLDNTLDTRLELAYEGLLPEIRTRLFGKSQIQI
eukprot:TRINITY_DN320_c0_g1_i3.p1 TRINITY_DN320_c0_g1~~TRINITY_DN320_c0_g1_i3.p1  ORF type:complete len:244 (-),score=135.32 TRINITY_DN320_c0_g1_i3:115-774(-)